MPNLKPDPPAWLVEVHRVHRPIARSAAPAQDIICNCTYAGEPEEFNGYVAYTPEHIARAVHEAFAERILSIISTKQQGEQYENAG
jgi:hypothetical protein